MDDFVNGISHSSCEYKRSECLLDFVACVGSVDEYIRWKCVQITENHSYRLLIGINVTHSRKNWYFRWLYPILRSYFRRCEANECAGIKVSWNKNFWHINNIDGISYTSVVFCCCCWWMLSGLFVAIWLSVKISAAKQNSISLDDGQLRKYDQQKVPPTRINYTTLVDAILPSTLFPSLSLSISVSFWASFCSASSVNLMAFDFLLGKLLW